MFSVSRSFKKYALRSSQTIQSQATRNLHLHEYQSKALMEKFDIRVKMGVVARTVEEAVDGARSLIANGPNKLVIKSQIHAGGRGKGHFPSVGLQGGVHVVDSVEQIQHFASQMLGNNLVTKQTGPAGQPVNIVLIDEGLKIQGEYYFAILMDRAYGGPVIVVSPRGGMDIEAVAKEDPSAIHMIPIDIMEGIKDEHAAKAADILGFEGETREDAIQQFKNLYRLFTDLDCTQVEINPLVLTDNRALCLDAKLNFDDNAAFRQKDIFALADSAMEDPREVAAQQFDLNYIGLDGNIGCMVNGAGLAMATMDIIKLHGGSPANFLDVGGGANAKQVEEAFKLLTSDPNVKALFVNIFGGIMRCDTIAEGIIAAAKNIDIKIPLVVRLEGTNVEAGIKMLKESGIAVIPAQNLDVGASIAVKSTLEH